MNNHGTGAHCITANLSILVFLICLQIGAGCLLGSVDLYADTASNKCNRTAGALRAVAGVIDGETLSLDDGSKVRLIGALSPHAWDARATSDSWRPEQGAKVALENLVSGKSIRLYYLEGQRRDRYGRRLAHAFIESGPGKNEKSLWIQSEMIKHGHARAYGLSGNFACLARLVAVEEIARAARTGLWANAAYAVRSAIRTGELRQYIGTYQLVSGTITDVAKRGGVIYLNFGPRSTPSSGQPAKTSQSHSASETSTTNWRTDFTAYIPKGGATAKNSISFNKDLIGKTVLVRGWLELRNGPAIRIHDPSQIKFSK